MNDMTMTQQSTSRQPHMGFHRSPKAWMTTSREERMTMYTAAVEARDEVLVGGLGMGI